MLGARVDMCCLITLTIWARPGNLAYRPGAGMRSGRLHRVDRLFSTRNTMSDFLELGARLVIAALPARLIRLEFLKLGDRRCADQLPWACISPCRCPPAPASLLGYFQSGFVCRCSLRPLLEKRHHKTRYAFWAPPLSPFRGTILSNS